ncbi:hypothetical protein [Collinsella aerofaciens]|uniref:hypothetical protein n=1 Tax=Collinsella aerofaciens TaxID=74426 RepID=UPI00232DE8D8|nr:hypothetical protein [Collinsella aerofaciens]MDB1908169.1 hypothetical protein [Collinsella aerofaciens]
MKAYSDKSKQSNKAMHRVLAGVLCGASVLSLVLSLVMPPISQAIANDGQEGAAEETVTAADSSTESTDVENTNNGDAENQNSDETESDESGDDSQPEEQPEEEQQNEGRTTSDGETVVTAAQNEQTEAAAVQITSAEELRDKLQGVKAGETASFELMSNIDYNDEIFLRNKGSNITLNLNGCKIKHSGDGTKPLFSVSNGAEFTITDNPNHSGDRPLSSVVLDDQGQKFTPDYYGKNGKVGYDNDIPNKLTYYVTTSSVNDTGTGTTETRETYEVNIQGAIVSTAPKGSTLKLINVYTGGKFNLQGGTLTQAKDCNVGHLIYAENGSTVNMSGGYVCGASGSGDGAGIMVSNEQGGASTLKLTGGVIAGNSAYNGGGVYARYSKVTITNGVISGNSTLNEGLGGGIMAKGGIVSVSDGYITNNRMAKFCGKDGNGDHGGAGLAANYGAKVTISDGQITGNYSEEAGGGVYVTDVERNGQTSRSGMARLNITGGIIASNVSYRSEGAGVRVGQMVDAMINGTEDNKVYITNNHCMSRFDWGGGGIFVQGNSNANMEKTAGRLFVYNSYISSNTAGGYGGGVAVCPTGKTLVTNTEGTAIFGNTDAKDASSFTKYDPQNNNNSNNGSLHLSGGGEGKDQDWVAYNSVDSNNEHVFRKNGHADFFLAAEGHTTPVAVVSGKMLGNIDAKYSGSIELTNRITIPANGVVGVKNNIGLTSDVKATDQAVTDAVQGKVQGTKVTTFITDNYSWDHGGGIMSNGDLYLGQPADAYVYPSLKATKELIDSQTDEKKPLTENEFTFKVYRKDLIDPFANGTFDRGVCTEVGNAGNDANGNITFNLGEQSAPSSSAGEITYYLVEDAGNNPYIKYDPAVYEIVGTLQDNVTVLMSVPTLNDESKTKEISVHNYTLTNTRVIKHSGDLTKSLGALKDDGQGYYSIVDSSSATSTNKATFTNTYTSSFSWTPRVTKVVEGGEMKVFTLKLADNPKFENAQEVKTQANGLSSQLLKFGDISCTLDDPTKGADSTGRSASKDFPYYYVREEDESEKYPHYKFDHSVYRFKVDRTDVANGTINYKVTYMKGTVDSEGNWTPEDNAEVKTFIDTSAPNSTDTSIPTFTNTYSTSLPLSGMSGVTLTYLAGAAVLCAAAAWMHIRRKANAKGGKRRE